MLDVDTSSAKTKFASFLEDLAGDLKLVYLTQAFMSWVGGLDRVFPGTVSRIANT